jgi:hypothetical protein
MDFPCWQSWAFTVSQSVIIATELLLAIPNGCLQLCMSGCLHRGYIHRPAFTAQSYSQSIGIFWQVDYDDGDVDKALRPLDYEVVYDGSGPSYVVIQKFIRVEEAADTSRSVSPSPSQSPDPEIKPTPATRGRGGRRNGAATQRGRSVPGAAPKRLSARLRTATPSRPDAEVESAGPKGSSAAAAAKRRSRTVTPGGQDTGTEGVAAAEDPGAGPGKKRRRTVTPGQADVDPAVPAAVDVNGGVVPGAPTAGALTPADQRHGTCTDNGKGVNSKAKKAENGRAKGKSAGKWEEKAEAEADGEEEAAPAIEPPPNPTGRGIRRSASRLSGRLAAVAEKVPTEQAPAANTTGRGNESARGRKRVRGHALAPASQTAHLSDPRNTVDTKLDDKV